jgi:ParB family chromosome partitioning protein
MSRNYTNQQAKVLKRTSNHLRFDLGEETHLRQLGRSYLDRPIYPIICNEALEILDGNRRHAGVMLQAPDAEVPVCITGEPFSQAAKIEIQLESSSHTRGLSQYEEFIGFSEWLKLNAGATAKDLAGRIHRDEPTISKILSLAKCIEAVRQAAADGKIGYSKWWTVSKLPPDEQPALLAQLLSGATRDELERESRRRRNGGGKPAVRVSRVKCPMPNGIAVAFTGEGEGMLLSDLIDTLAELLKEAKRANDQGLDARTFQAVMRDRAKAAG